ncbi:oligogalacturonate lyase family protein, partial [Acinetobacter variabilis]|uniref:oligogalacturonate lyase family protein n=1 Tax=Acinetobacter variabilis TaxID=70346 RepID=UPI0030F582F5
DPWLYVFNVAEKRYFRVARHDTSWATVANSRQVTCLAFSTSASSKCKYINAASCRVIDLC